jgi:hypothetical protein
MTSAADFKKHISKPLGEKMRSVGFKGSGFYFLQDSKNFVFTFGVQASRYGGQCCAEYGIQPKALTKIGNYELNFSKLKYSECELRRRLAKTSKGLDQWWTYSDNEDKNIQIATEMFDLFIEQAIPTISAFKANPNILDTIAVSDLDNCYVNVSKKLAGISPMFGNIRFAWALAKIYAGEDPDKAREFAAYGLSKLDEESLFFGKEDFEKILEMKSSA